MGSICVGLKRLRLAKGIVKRPQTIRTRDGFCQPPHRYVIDAFHWALLLRIARIANYRLSVNTKNSELQKIIYELKNSCGEVLKIKLVTYEPSRDFHNAHKTCKMQAAAFRRDSKNGVPIRHTTDRAASFPAVIQLPRIVRGVGHHFLAVWRHLDAEFNGLAVQFVEGI
jgi:hypothetical protein